EGVTAYFNKALLVDLRHQSNFKETVDIEVPENAVPNSAYIQLNGIGNIMGNVINNLNNLVRLPSGCGEQNMVNFVPNIVTLIYLTKIGKLTENLKTQLYNYLQIGYQTELTYKRYDNSFSTFGNTDISGSVWLTAFVVKSFEMASAYITVDSSVIANAKKYLLRSQVPDGSFKEISEAVTDIQGGSSQTPLTLTAYVLIALLETPTSDKTTYSHNIDKAILFLENNLDKADNSYSITIVAYALQLAKSAKANEAFDKMNSKSKKEGDLTYWHYTLPKRNESAATWRWQQQSQPLDIEATGYALLTYINKGESATNQLPLVSWLVSQQSSIGGYRSTQDTVIGIQALGLAAPNFVGPVGSTVKLSAAYGSNSADLTFSQQNELVQQQQEIVPNTIRSVNIKANGNGIAIVQIEWTYNVVIHDIKNNAFNQTLTVTPLMQSSNTVNSYVLRVCSSYLHNGTSGMVIVQLNTLSGFTWSILPAPNSSNGPQRVETSNDDTVVSLYYNQFPNHAEVCSVVVATESTFVSNRKNAYTSVFRYYYNDDRAESAYNLPTEV
ncbi:CD109 molecule, partial [Chamberlinius hualienensis]